MQLYNKFTDTCSALRTRCMQAHWLEAAGIGSVTGLGHRDKVTEDKERAAVELGSMSQAKEDEPPGFEPCNGSCHLPDWQGLRKASPEAKAEGQAATTSLAVADQMQQEAAAAAAIDKSPSEECFRAQLAVQKLVTGLQQQDAVAALSTIATILRVRHVHPDFAVHYP